MMGRIIVKRFLAPGKEFGGEERGRVCSGYECGIRGEKGKKRGGGSRQQKSLRPYWVKKRSVRAIEKNLVKREKAPPHS